MPVPRRIIKLVEMALSDPVKGKMIVPTAMAAIKAKTFISPICNCLLSAFRGWKYTPFIPQPMEGRIKYGRSEIVRSASCLVNLLPTNKIYIKIGAIIITAIVTKTDTNIDIIFDL